MKTNRSLRRLTARRRVGEQTIQALAITSQMALLYPPGVDEWMRRELGVETSNGHRQGNGVR